MPKSSTTPLVLMILLLLASPLAAAKLAGVSMGDTAKVGEETLVLNGLGLRKKAIFKVYVGALYLPKKQSDGGAILAADEPRRLAMEFVRKVGADSLVGAWNDCLTANSPNASADVRKGFESLNGWMADVGSGDRLVFTYSPAGGTEVQVKGTKKGVVAGKPFADALFACWIGDVPPSEDFKKGLLGG
ncbi:MAG: chalcone isomerase family protein [Acidobacteriota bacterium]